MPTTLPTSRPPFCLLPSHRLALTPQPSRCPLPSMAKRASLIPLLVVLLMILLSCGTIYSRDLRTNDAEPLKITRCYPQPIACTIEGCSAYCDGDPDVFCKPNLCCCRR
uniref:Uncharacterized protein n=1 Tax=Opuntia streptacantha TaxID=393608 RepID=A0A7C8ZDE6_OPUST